MSHLNFLFIIDKYDDCIYFDGLLDYKQSLYIFNYDMLFII